MCGCGKCAADLMSVRILHGADLHLDTAFEGLPEELAVRRRAEQREMLPRMVQLVKRHGCQAVLLAGDLFDGPKVYAETITAVEQALAEMAVPVLIAPGNHDYYRAGCIYDRLNLPDNVQLFHSNTISCLPFPALGLRVWGAGFTDSVCPPLLGAFSPPEKEEGVADVLCIHGTVGREDPYNPMTPEQLAASGMDYVAMGHAHTCSGLQKAGNTAYLWPGVPMGRGFDETGVKGVVIADIAPGKVQAHFAPLGGREYRVLPVDVTGQTALTAVENALPAGAEKDLVRIVLTGTAAQLPLTGELEQALRGRVWYLEVQNQVRLAQDLWARRGEMTLRGLFLRKLYDRLETAGPEERELIEAAARWGIAALDGGEEVSASW